MISEEQNDINRERWKRAEELFHSALKLTPDERSGFLRVSCQDDEELLHEVESLLEHEKSSDSFIEAPAFEMAARQIASDEQLKVEPDALPPGTVLSHFRIGEKLGKGGMGEVYRARDNRLGRTVAIKILPEGHLAGEDARRRFQREARVLSGLSHPHICTIYDVGDEQGMQFIVMEYLEGETLAARLERGRLPAAQILQYAIEIADALEKAHRAGIVHRDLKPANIMITKSGIKLLDFGLARMTRRESAPLISMSGRTTEDDNITGAGTIIGTLQYMAPEQLEGRETDARTDIFAFGTVLYEMVTGQKAFRGSSQASLIAAILSSQPTPLLQLSPVSPPALDRLLHTCLEKDPEERCQSAHDVRLQLQWIRDAGLQAGVPRVKAQHRISRERTAEAAAIFLLLAFAATLAMHYFQPASPPARKIMFAVEAAAGYKVTLDGPSALSPDGTAIAYAAQDSKGKKSLWVHSFDSMSAKRLEGSETGADYYSFVWTPDSRAVIASVDGKLLRLSTAGGANEVLCDKFDAAPSSINREGTILAWTPPPTQVFSVSSENCTLRPRSPSQAQGVGYAYAHFLPDGRHFLFSAVRNDRHHDILLGSLSDLNNRVVVRNGSDPRYIDAGYILFSRDGYLMAQKFDGKSQSSSGEPFLVFSNQLNFYAAFGWAAFDASRNGFISVKEQYSPPMVMRWYSRSGQVLQTIGDSEYRTAARLTRQGTQAAVALFDPRTHVGDIWSVDFEHGTRRRETFHDRPAVGPSAWSSHGDKIVYSALVGNELEIFIKNTGSSGSGQMFQTGLSGGKLIGDVSPDGNWLVYLFVGSETSIYGQAIRGGKPFRLARAGAEEEAPRFSPDGHWVVYQSSESGSSEVYVRAFTAEVAPSVQASVGGGHDPRWSRDGNELFYRTNDGSIVGVPILDLKQRRFGKPVILFRLVEGAEYDTVDGKRFLVNEPAGATSSALVVIANWKPEPAKSP